LFALICGAAIIASNLVGCTTGDNVVAAKGEVAAPKGRAPVVSTARVDPQTLVGLTESEVRLRLGDPSSVREVAPSRVWRYTAGPCSLDLFFYFDLGSSKFRALFYKVAARENTRRLMASEICVGRIQTRYQEQYWTQAEEH